MGRTQKGKNQVVAIFSYERQLVISSSCSLHHTDPPRDQPQQHSQRATHITHEHEKSAVVSQRSRQHAEQNNQVNTAKETR
jgi:hypothetical protein